MSWKRLGKYLEACFECSKAASVLSNVTYRHTVDSLFVLEHIDFSDIRKVNRYNNNNNNNNNLFLLFDDNSDENNII